MTEAGCAMKRFKLLVAGMCVAAVVLSTSVAFAKPLSEQQWRKQANAVCSKSYTELHDIQNKVLANLGPNEEPSTAVLADYVEESTPVVNAMIASIDALKEPKALKKDVKKFLAAGSAVQAALQADPAALHSDTPDSPRPNPYVKVSSLALRLGLKTCAI